VEDIEEGAGSRGQPHSSYSPMQSYGNYPTYYGQPVYQQNPYPGPGPSNGYPPFNYPNNPTAFNIPRTENRDQPFIPPVQPAAISRQKAHRRSTTIPASAGSYPLRSALKKNPAPTDDPQPGNPAISRANVLTRSRTYSNASNLIPGTDPAFRPRSSHSYILSLCCI
jgi:hypothetical protein